MLSQNKIGWLYPSIVCILPSNCGLSLISQVLFHRLCLALNHGEEAGPVRADWWWNWACSPGGSAGLQSSEKRGRAAKVRCFSCLPGCSEPSVDKWKQVSWEYSLLLALSSEVFMSLCGKAYQLQHWASQSLLRNVTVALPVQALLGLLTLSSVSWRTGGVCDGRGCLELAPGCRFPVVRPSWKMTSVTWTILGSMTLIPTQSSARIPSHGARKGLWRPGTKVASGWNRISWPSPAPLILEMRKRRPSGLGSSDSSTADGPLWAVLGSPLTAQWGRVIETWPRVGPHVLGPGGKLVLAAVVHKSVLPQDATALSRHCLPPQPRSSKSQSFFFFFFGYSWHAILC